MKSLVRDYIAWPNDAIRRRCESAPGEEGRE